MRDLFFKQIFHKQFIKLALISLLSKHISSGAILKVETFFTCALDNRCQIFKK